MIANISQKINVSVCLLAISLLGMIGEVYWYNLPILSSMMFLIYIVTLGKSIGQRITGNKEFQLWIGSALTLSCISLSAVVFYYPYKLTPELSIVAILIPVFFLLKKKKNTDKVTAEPNADKRQILSYLFFVLEVVLIVLIIAARNGGLMPSPWTVFSPWFFVLFAASTSLFIYLLTKKTSARIMLIGTMIHFFIFYCIAAIVYQLGFGFDGFIHRATESWILQHGFIDPKEPFYIGQYGLVVTLSRITGIAIKYIDIFLVPILASISIPSLLYSILPKAWNITKQAALALSLFIPFVFFLSFHLTTPHNFVLLILLLTIVALVGYFSRLIPYSVVVTLGLLSVATHPLLGAPLLLIILAAKLSEFTCSKKIDTVLYLSIIVILACIPLAMFIAQQWLAGYGLPDLTNPLSHFQLFLDFFKRPFWYKADARWYLEILYAWQYLLTPAVIIFSLVGGWYLRKTKIAPLLLSSSIGLTIGAFLLRTLITFPNVSFHEQGNYPLRLLVGAIIILIPLGMYGVVKLVQEKITFIQEKLRLHTSTLYIIGSIKIGIVLTLSLYFSYPQYNGKVYFPGFNVTEYDKHVVEYIHNQNTEHDYVVLSTILTAVTALTEYPFEHYIDTPLGSQFYYSIPAGGPLYILYEEMLYQGQKRETIDKVFELTDTHRVYFVVPWYWKNSDIIAEGAKKTATSWQSIDGKMWVFEYLKDDSSLQAP